MTRQEIITELKKYFKLEELVCQHCIKTHGERSWQFLQTELLHTLLVLRRDIFGVPMTINKLKEGKDERGLRCNRCTTVQEKTKKGICYLSAHVNGAGDDADFEGYTAEQARQKIKANAHKLPYPIRLEKGVGWVHFDVYVTYPPNGQIITEF